MTSQPVGIYDSGIGGLTVLSHFLERFPRERFVYCADTANLPYGEKRADQLVAYACAMLSWLQQAKNVKLIIIACHTSSALALESVAPLASVPLIGTIIPTANHLVQHSSFKKVAVLATAAAAAHRGHEQIFVRQGFIGEVLSVGCPRFVPLIEAGHFQSEPLVESARDYLKPIQEFMPEVLVYGCTHYPWIRPLIERLLPPTLMHLDPAQYIADEASPWLDSTPLAPKEPRRGVEFYTTGEVAPFRQKIERLMPTTSTHASFYALSLEASSQVLSF